MAFRETVEGRLADIERQLDAMEMDLEPILRCPVSENLQSFTPLDQAKIGLSLAYTMETLFYLHLRMLGGVNADHPIHMDLDRIKSYVNKLKQAEGDLNKRGQVRINAQVASRFIRNALGGEGVKQSEAEDDQVKT